MAGRGRTPKDPSARIGTEVPQRGEWKPAPGIGWQHGDIPEPPAGLMPRSVQTWEIWFSAWYAAHWAPADLPAIEVMIGLFDQIQRGEFQRSTELRYQMDTWGVTPKGQQDRRWKPPEAPKVEQAATGTDGGARGRYAHLAAVPAEPAEEPKATRRKR